MQGDSISYAIKFEEKEAGEAQETGNGEQVENEEPGGQDQGVRR